MALIKCPECGRDVSDTTAVCIHCGCRFKRKKTVKRIRVAVAAFECMMLFALIVGGILVYIWNRAMSVPKLTNVYLWEAEKILNQRHMDYRHEYHYTYNYD